MLVRRYEVTLPGLEGSEAVLFSLDSKEAKVVLFCLGLKGARQSYLAWTSKLRWSYFAWAAGGLRCLILPGT